MLTHDSPTEPQNPHSPLCDLSAYLKKGKTVRSCPRRGVRGGAARPVLVAGESIPAISQASRVVSGAAFAAIPVIQATDPGQCTAVGVLIPQAPGTKQAALLTVDGQSAQTVLGQIIAGNCLRQRSRRQRLIAGNNRATAFLVDRCTDEREGGEPGKQPGRIAISAGGDCGQASDGQSRGKDKSNEFSVHEISSGLE